MSGSAVTAFKILDSKRLMLDELSIAEDSGWRELDSERVAELADLFRAGDYGATTLAAPSVLFGENQQYLQSQVDGRIRLNNGLSTIAALKLLEKEYKAALAETAAGGTAPHSAGGTAPLPAGGTDPHPAGGTAPDPAGGTAPLPAGGAAPLEPPEWARGRLLEALIEGVRVDVVQYTNSEDYAIVVAINGLQHDAEQNKYTPTSITTKIQIVRTQRERVEGGDWGLALAALLRIYGPSKRRTVSRWIALARDLPEAVQAHFASRRLRALPHNFVFDNKFLVGRGEEARYKLSPEFAIIALDLVVDRVEAALPVSASMFATEFCSVMKLVERFQITTVKTYGKAAETFPAFQRVIRLLCSENGRQRVLACLRDKQPIAGVPGKSEAAGIEEARLVIEELSKMKAGTDASKDRCMIEQNAGGDCPASSVDAAGGECPAGCAEVEDEDLVMASESKITEDPVQVRARVLAEKDLAHIAYHQKTESFLADVSSRVFRSQRVVAFLDMPTSRLKVFADSIKLVASLGLERLAVMIPVGRRIDVMAGVLMNVKKAFPKQTPYVIQFDAGDKQTTRSIPTYAVYVPAVGIDNSEPVPSSLRANACKAHSCE